MKKFTITFLIFFLIFFSSTKTIHSYAENVFKEGIYKSSDFNFSEGNVYSISNVSADRTVFIEVFDKDQLLLQALRLNPKSPKFNLIPLRPDYRIVIVGSGEVYISP
jgi:hypothetical protein